MSSSAAAQSSWHRWAWALSLLLSAAGAALMVLIWVSERRQIGDEISVVRSMADVQALLDAPDAVQLRGGERPVLIPTGFFIQSVAFVSASDVNLSGYIWQKYPEDYPEHFGEGIVFPDEVGAAGTTLTERYRTRGVQGGTSYETVGWYFDVTLRQSFEYGNYPLEFHTVWLRIWAADFENDDRILLVPDFAAYDPADRPIFGMDHEIVQGTWEIDRTFFSYNNIPYDTNFGYIDFPARSTYKEFFINIGLKRKFLNAFVINLVPLLLAAILLFAALLTITHQSDRAERFGFSAAAVLGTCSALFFVVLLAHVQVRARFEASGLVYIEYFYVIMYFMILAVAANGYMFSLGAGSIHRWLAYQDNLAARLAYWPVLTWAMALATLGRFRG